MPIQLKVGIQAVTTNSLKKALIAKVAIAAQALTGKPKYEAHIGVLEGATNASGEGIPPIVKALYNEFGTVHIPERSFLRTTATEKRNVWESEITALLKQGYTPKEALLLVAEEAQKDVVQKLENGSSSWEPLASATIAARKRKGKKTNLEKPLIDTGDMEKAIAYEVVKK